MTTNNPMMAIMSAIRHGRNPNTILQQLAMQDPRVHQAQNIMAGKTPEQLRQICTNMCSERGTTPEEVARSLGIPGI